MKCRVCGKEYDKDCDDYELLDALGGLGVDYEHVCSDCLHTGFHKLAVYTRKIFKEDI